MRATTSDDTPLTDRQRRFTFGLIYDVTKVLEAHGLGPFDGRQLVELRQHLHHFLYGAADERCYGKPVAAVAPISDMEAHRTEIARKVAALRQSGAAVEAALGNYDPRRGNPTATPAAITEELPSGPAPEVSS